MVSNHQFPLLTSALNEWCSGGIDLRNSNAIWREAAAAAPDEFADHVARSRRFLLLRTIAAPEVMHNRINGTRSKPHEHASNTCSVCDTCNVCMVYARWHTCVSCSLMRCRNWLLGGRRRALGFYLFCTVISRTTDELMTDSPPNAVTE